MDITPYIFRCHFCGNKKSDSYCKNCHYYEKTYQDYYHKCDYCHSYYEGNLYYCVVCGKHCMPMIDTFLCECGITTPIYKTLCKCGNPTNFYGFSIVLKKKCMCSGIKVGRYCYICGKNKKDYCSITIF